MAVFASAVSGLASFFSGNKLLQQYELDKNPVSYLKDSRWKIHSARHKERVDEIVSVFVFEKKDLDGHNPNEREKILGVLRRDASQLQRLRHPNIMHIVEPLVEDRSCLAFATRPVSGTLLDLLNSSRAQLCLLEVKSGLLDIAEALHFLHRDARTAHLAVAPSSIFINSQGRWLIGGLGHSHACPANDSLALFECGFDFSSSSLMVSPDPPLQYAAPEMMRWPPKGGALSDAYSLGLLAFELLSPRKKPLLEGVRDKNSHSRMAKEAFDRLPSSLQGLDMDIASVIRALLHHEPSSRQNVSLLAESPYLQSDIHVKALRFLESLSDKDHQQRAQFLQGVTSLIFPPSTSSPLGEPRMLRERVLPPLSEALLFSNLWPYLLPILIKCIETDKVLDPPRFMSVVWPRLRVLFSAKEISVECVSVLLGALDRLLTLCDSVAIAEVLIPFVLKCSELSEENILRGVLSKLPLLLKRLEGRTVQDQLLPRLMALLTTQQTPEKIKAEVLGVIKSMVPLFDKSTLSEKVLPALEELSKDKCRPILAAPLLGTVEEMGKIMGPRLNSSRLLPLLCPLLAEDSWPHKEHMAVRKTLRDLLGKVERSRDKDYAVRSEQGEEVSTALGSGPSAPSPPPRSGERGDQDLSGLLGIGGPPSSGFFEEERPARPMLCPPPGAQKSSSSPAPPVHDLFAGVSGPALSQTRKSEGVDLLSSGSGVGTGGGGGGGGLDLLDFTGGGVTKPPFGGSLSQPPAPTFSNFGIDNPVSTVNAPPGAAGWGGGGGGQWAGSSTPAFSGLQALTSSSTPGRAVDDDPFAEIDGGMYRGGKS